MQKKLTVIIMVLFIITFWGSAAFFFLKSQKSTASKQFTIIPNVTPVPSLVTKLVNTVSQQTDLPKNETPSVATVKDVNKLPPQLFFAKAKNGDKILIYQIAKKAILYRPSTNEIVQVSPLIIVPPGVTASDSGQLNASSSPALRVQL